jgi:hypothetical protein
MYLLKKSFATKTNVLLIAICSTALAISACKKCNKHENVGTDYKPTVGEKWKFNYYDTASKLTRQAYFMIAGIDSVVKDTTFYRFKTIKNFEEITIGNTDGSILKYKGGLRYRGLDPQNGNFVDFHLIFGMGKNQALPIDNWYWKTDEATTKYVAYHATKNVNGTVYKDVEEFVTTCPTYAEKIDIHQFFTTDHLLILQEGYHELAGEGLRTELSLVEHRLQ